MNNSVDLLVEKNENGIYDLKIAPNGDLFNINSFNTALLMTLLCERRANESQVSPVFLRRGWVGNDFNTVNSNITNFEMGSLFWLLAQKRKTTNTLNEGIDALRNGFSWLVEGNYASAVNANGRITASGMDFIVLIRVGKDIINTNSYNLWINTATTNVTITVIP